MIEADFLEPIADKLTLVQTQNLVKIQPWEASGRELQISKSVGKNTTVLRKINEAETLFPPAFCLLPPASFQLQIFTPFYLVAGGVR
ncbi:hypothetical protein [Microcoleus sp. F10-D1]|uniref:hypothetical protein n=1 Tax=Microcoleus sp. F10-D1 TaxID=2818758 RepID=UPI002FD01576